MTSDLANLYQQAVLDHSRNPRRRHELPGATETRRLDNRTCGDWVELSFKVENGVIAAAAFRGEGCALAIAGADLCCLAITGKTPAQAQALCRDFLAALDGDAAAGDRIATTPASCLLAAREYPARRGCVTLGWEALDQ